MATDILDAAASETLDWQSAQADASASIPPGTEAETSEPAEPELAASDAPESAIRADTLPLRARDSLEPGLVNPAEELATTDTALESPSSNNPDTEAAPGELAPVAQPASAGEGADETPQTAPTEPAAEAVEADPAGVSAEAASAEDSTPDSAPVSTPTWEDADTIEYNVVIQPGQTMDAAPIASQPTDMPAQDELANAHGDALPWPLPQSIIVGGRYRVEEALTIVPDAPGAENVYRVHDLQGYERCWSCGAEHETDATPDRFCQECGADMLSRDYLMYERRQEDESQQNESQQEESEAMPSDDAPREQSVRAFTQGARDYRVVPRVEPPLFPRGVRVVAALATDTGAARAGEENEDSAGVLTLSVAYESRIEPLTLCVVADGLGGHASGQEASRLTVRILAEHILRGVTLPFISPPVEHGESETSFEIELVASLEEGVEAANKAICDRNTSTRADMGSTCVAALVHRDTAYFVNAGDSRGYVLEESGLRRITTDHSLVEQLIAARIILPEERYTHPQRNQIFRSLGDEPNVALDTFTQKLRPGMRLLLCSDGLWEMVRDDEMAQILRETASPQQACDLLIFAANEHGGEDNISAVVVDISA